MYCAIDIGNSKVEILLMSADGRSVRFLRGGSLVPNVLAPEGTVAALMTLIGETESPITHTWAAVAGVDFSDQAEAMERAFDRVQVFGNVAGSE